jgi:hypothetical protein
MHKIIDRYLLFLSSWSPGEIYLGAAILLGISFLILLAFGLVHLLHKGEFTFSLFSVPAFVSLFSFVSSLLILFIGKINIFICFVSIIIALFLTYIFLLSSGEMSSASCLLFRKPIRAKIDGYRKSSFYLVLFLLVLFFLLSIDHNYLPAQYDITTYQFLSDVVSRHGTYPTIDFAGDHELHVLPPPGYFGIDFLIGLAWDSPRRVLLISTLFLLCVTLALIRLGAVFFSNSGLEPFMLYATFCRGLYWNYWEFNVQRELSLLASLMFLICTVLSYREDTAGKRLHYLIFGQLFLTTAFMCHPENTAYIIVGVFAYIGFALILKGFQKDRNYIYWAVHFICSLIISLSIFLYWYVSVVRETSRDYLTAELASPVPEMMNLLFHFNGIVPVVLFFVGIILMFVGNRKKEGLLFSLLFLLPLFLAYFKYLLHLVLPEVFELVEREYDDFNGTRFWVIGPYAHPHAVIVKMTSLWWSMILVSGWVYHYLWGILRNINRFVMLSTLLVLISLVFGDIFYMYYNKPIIDEDEYQFLVSLKDRLPDDAIIVAPAQYYFSAWTGPVLQRDSLSSRTHYHATNSIAPDLYPVIEAAYTTGNFEPLLCMLPREKAVILFDKARADAAILLAEGGNWRVILAQNGNYALGWDNSSRSCLQ